jgi:transposase
MITAEMRVQMRRLVLVEGWRVETVARKFGVHHSTVRRAIDDTPAAANEPTLGKLDPHKEYIVDRLVELPELTGARLFGELQKKGFTGSLSILRRYVAKVRQPRSRKAYLRIETEPGEQAQVDWGSFGHFRIGGAQRPLSAFVMVMSWSRAIFVDFSLDQQMETFLRMHRRALEFFGGVPKRVLYDNLKSVVLHRVGSTVQFNPRFLQLAGHYLFEPTAAAVRYPEAKGKVENGVKYVRSSFFYGRTFSSMEDLRRQAAEWRDQVANARIHGTTRERPADRLLIERARLRALPERPFDADVVLPCVASSDCRVRFDSNSYSVPYSLVGKDVLLRADDVSVRVVHDGAVVAEHERSWGRRVHVEDPAHVEKLLERRRAAQGPKRKESLAALGAECRQYLQEVARRRINLEHEVRKLMRLRRAYGDEDLARGMGKALVSGTFGARYVRALMDQDRFARGLAEPTDPVVTGNRAADDFVVEPHPMESYDALFASPATNDESAS